MLVHKIEKDDSGKIIYAKIQFETAEMAALLTYALNVLIVTGMMAVPVVEDNEAGEQATLKDWVDAAVDKKSLN